MADDSRKDTHAASVPIWDDAQTQLDHFANDDQLRSLKLCESASGPLVRVGPYTLVNFSSNNYLDLAADPRVVDAAKKALHEFGAGAGASRLVTGTLPLHADLESHISEFKGAESALVFSSGYMANLGLVQALSQRADGSRVQVFFDRLAHASLVDAALYSGTKWRSFRHNDTGKLCELLSKASQPGLFPSALVLTESVFSMDGDLAPLPVLLEICERHGALLVVDDAHGTGTIGPGGCGGAAHFGLGKSSNLIQMGTLSKALGSQGGFVAGPKVLTDLLINKARPFIYDTALAPPCAAAAIESLAILNAEPRRLDALRENVRYFKRVLNSDRAPMDDAAVPIVPFIIGDAAKTLAASEALRGAGFLVAAIRPPTVPKGTSRLRITIMSSHTREQLDGLAYVLRGI